jgi:bleomycin hydrolase
MPDFTKQIVFLVIFKKKLNYLIMKTYLLKTMAAIIALILSFTFLSAQDVDEKQDTYQFTHIKEIPVTDVKNQFRSGTCWSFSGLSFLEAEIIRMGKGEFDLSKMWIVRFTYLEKAIKYVRMHGHMNFSAGGAFHDVFNMIDKYGIVPENVYQGLEYGEDKHVHGEVDIILKNYVDAVKANKNRKLSTAWIDGYNGVLDAYFGKVPAEFEYKGKDYTPKTFADYLGINKSDYINLTSYTHHPFYETFIMEIPDNWAWGHAYNVPIDELMEIFDYAINNGFTVCWGSDVSEKGFSWTNGIAINPEEERPDLDGLERSRWENLSAKEREKLLFSFEEIVPEKQVTQEMRQIAFDNFQTTDDHGMVINGIAKDQNGTKYYLVKNSWDTSNKYDGFLYASESFVKYKTMNIVVHKEAIPKNIQKKLNI